MSASWPGRRAPLLVGIAGGSGSGKTTLARAAAAALGTAQASILDQDAYYRDRGDLAPEARGALDFDVPEALDLALFVDHLARLRRGETVTPPLYCFVTHRRLGAAPPLAPRPVVIVEGLLLFHDPAVRAQFDLGIYVHAPEAVRLARRLWRDVSERGREPAAVLDQCRTTVLPAHARFVEPTRTLADLVLDNTGALDAAVERAVAAIGAALQARARDAGQPATSGIAS
jgi:uridine kinase